MRRNILAAAVVASVANNASAFQIDAGEGCDIRWDNAAKYNLMMRVATRDKDITEAAGTGRNLLSDPDASFDRGDIVSNRLDILSELDVVWKGTAGFRISAAGWYDHAYSNGYNSKSFDGSATVSNNISTGLSAQYGAPSSAIQWL